MGTGESMRVQESTDGYRGDMFKVKMYPFSTVFFGFPHGRVYSPNTKVTFLGRIVPVHYLLRKKIVFFFLFISYRKNF